MKTDTPGLSSRTVGLVVAGLGAGLLIMIVLLTLVLSVLEDSQQHIASQDEKVSAVYDAAQPLIDEAKPASMQASDLVDKAIALLHDARPAVQAAEPAIESASASISRVVTA